MKKQLLVLIIFFASTQPSDLLKKINFPITLKHFSLHNIIVGLGAIGASLGTIFSNNNTVRVLLRKTVIDSTIIFNMQSKKNFTAYNCLEPLIFHSVDNPTAKAQYIAKFLGYVLSQEAVFYATRYAGEKIFKIKTPEKLFQYSIWSALVFKMILVSTLALKKQNKNSETKNIVKELKADIKKLQKDKKSLTKTCSKKELQNKKNLKAKNNLNKKITNLKAKIETLQNRLKDVTEQNASQNNTIASQENANKLLKRNVIKLQEKNKNLNLQIKQLEYTLEDLQKENNFKEDINNETKNENLLLESQFISLQSRLVTIKNKKCLLEKKINLFTENNNTLQEEIVTLKTMLLDKKELIATIEELTKHNNRLQEEKISLATHEANIKKSLEDEKNRLVSENLASEYHLNEEIKKFQESAYQKKIEIETITKKCNSLNLQIQTLQDSLNTLQSKYDQLSYDYSQLKIALEQNIKKLDTAINTKSQKEYEKENVINDLRVENESLRNQLYTMRNPLEKIGKK